MTNLPTPIGRQREVVFLESKGHTVVLGTAGSGKTTMAIHRAINLQKRCPDPRDKTLLVTFNKMLVRYIESFRTTFPPGLCIENYHKTLRGFLAHKKKMHTNAIVGPGIRKKLIQKAQETLQSSYPNDSFLQRPVSLFTEEIKWISQFGIRNLADYIQVERVGRSGKGTRIERSHRGLMWRVYQEYKTIRAQHHYLYDWDDVAIEFEYVIKTDNSSWQYRHVIIDEGQDFSPTMLRGLAAAIPTNGSLTFFGDVAQQIYGIRVSWKNAGLNTRKIWEFKENYRNTKAIADLAVAISQMPYFEFESDLVTPNAPRAEGPKPSLVKLQNSSREKSFITNLAAQWGHTQSVAILLQHRGNDMHQMINTMRSKNLTVTELHRDRGNFKRLRRTGVYVGTYQSAKGLEFDTVIMPYCNSRNWPDSERVLEVGEFEAVAEAGRLIYVGVTRAKSRLILTFSDELTPLLPPDKSLYNHQE